MKKRNIILVLAILPALLFSSCSNWLDLLPQDGVPRDEFWKTKEDVHSAVIGAYTSITEDDAIARIFLYGEWRADMISAFRRDNDYVNAVFDGEITDENTWVKWGTFYTTINQCNTVLKYASGAYENDSSFTELLLHQYEAEVTALRSLMYFYLVRAFGDVPFIREAYTTTAQDLTVAKTRKEEIIEQLIADLESVKDDIPESYSTTNVASNKGRMTRWGLKALLADLYLWAEDYENCIKYADEIIDSGQFSLVPVDRQASGETGSDGNMLYTPSLSSMNEFFRQMYYEGNSVESIFELQFSDGNLNYFYTMMRPAAGYVGVKLDVFTNEIFNYVQSDYYDIRYMINQSQSAIWKYTGIEPNGTARTAADQYTGNWIFYRLAEVYLMKAEALTQLAIRAGDDRTQLDQALELVRKIRDRSNATEETNLVLNDPQFAGATLEKFILSERAREMAYEGKRWFDILRHAKRDNYAGNNLNYLLELATSSAPADKVTTLQTKYKDPNSHYLPIYFEEIESNPKLVQNEFYN